MVSANEPARFLLKRDYIVEKLRAAITGGEFQPGQKLRQEELAARFQISSTPVREALRILEAEGLVTSVPHQGVFVTRLSEAEILEHYRLRALLETYATGEATANLKKDPVRREQVLLELYAIQTELKAAIAAHQSEDTVRLNHQVHLRLYEEADSPRLKQMIIDLWKGLPFNTLWLVEGHAEKAQKEHEDLFEAIRQGDRAAAEEIIRCHIEQSGEAFRRQFRAGLLKNEGD